MPVHEVGCAAVEHNNRKIDIIWAIEGKGASTGKYAN